MFRLRAIPATILAAFCFCLFFASTAGANETCRVAYDMGSSGIRAGASNSALSEQVDIDYLGPFWAGRGLADTALPTISALIELPLAAGFSPVCARVGGGFSVWRLALQQDAAALIRLLKRIHEASGVAVLVIPQTREGAYGYAGARRLLGDRLTSSHILDIGGGSLQIAGARHSFGDVLGQKVWHRMLCLALRHSPQGDCVLPPMSDDDLATARAMLVRELHAVSVALPDPVTMTAISRPVSRGVLPAVARVSDVAADEQTLALSSLRAAIRTLSGLSIDETMRQTNSRQPYVNFLLSDMLLVEGLMWATAVDELSVAELDLSNVPGLLADDHAFAWVNRYGCYLKRLEEQGLIALNSDPATCE